LLGRKTIGLLVSVALLALLFAASLDYLPTQRAPSSSTTEGRPPTLSTVTVSGSAVLRLSLDIQAGGNGTYKIRVHETGLANWYNITAANLWKYPHDSLNLFSPCGFTSPIGLAILQGYFNPNNFTLGKALTLYDTSIAYLCTAKFFPVAYYLFSPSSNSAQVFDSHGDSPGNESMSIDLLTSGYWTGGYGAGPGPAQFLPFSGTETVVAADEWGAVAISHFNATPLSATGLNLSLSLNASSIRAGHEIAFTASLFNTRTTENNVSSASNWALPYLIAGPCGPTDSPIAFAVLQGFYTPLNISNARIQYGQGCTTVMGGVRFYLFQPMSSTASVFAGCSPDPCFTKSMTSSRSLNGYWSGNQYFDFAPGVYTILVADEWGDFAVAHFTVQS